MNSLITHVTVTANRKKPIVCHFSLDVCEFFCWTLSFSAHLSSTFLKRNFLVVICLFLSLISFFLLLFFASFIALPDSTTNLSLGMRRQRRSARQAIFFQSFKMALRSQQQLLLHQQRPPHHPNKSKLNSTFIQRAATNKCMYDTAVCEY